MTTALAMTELPKSYVPAEHERQIRARWEESGVFHAVPRREGDDRPPYCILIPLPNVTAALHLGHALNNTLQDVLTRYHRMQGFNTLWMPGTDHAGIATQTVVEQRLIRTEGRKRTDYERDEFVAIVQKWKDEYEATITEQLKAFGCSCDWDRQRFTMDPMCARAVREAFFRLFKEGLIYRGKRLVNWDPATQTALADDEVENVDIKGHFWYLKYPIVDDAGKDTGEFVTVATTRPETMLGDTAVAVNPNDPPRARYIGRKVRLPIVNRIVPIIADDYVVIPDPASDDPKAQYATGFLKVTPAHDPNDWEIGQRHDLPVINILAPDASISRDHGWPPEEFESAQAKEAGQFLGMSREDASAAVAKWFEEHGLLEEVRDYAHTVGHSYRSHVAIEPYLSDQWYAKVTDDRLVGEAQRALCDEQFEGVRPEREDASGSSEMDGDLRFYPPRYAKMYQSWHINLRDWCISRQLWWGHRIPVWYAIWDVVDETSASETRPWIRTKLGFLTDEENNHIASQPMPGRGDGKLLMAFCVEPGFPEIERKLKENGFAQDPDVLDTWFSSALWPLSTMGWPEPADFPETVGLLETFNPTSVLVTAREIITLWVSRMVMFNRFFNEGKLPYYHVYIHPMIQDGHGQRMSKSLGNGVDPRDIIHSHGADALRFTMVQMATSTQDVRLPVDTMCPHCEQVFHPKEITSPAGYRVAAPRQTCPLCGGKLVTAYGRASATAEPTEEEPAALNTSAKFDLGRNFCNKLWNASRFALSGLKRDKGTEGLRDRGERALVDRWILSRLSRTHRAVEAAVREYQFNVYAETMYDFVWRDFCDWYLEAIKPTVRDDPTQQQVLRTVLNAILRMLHPICPFVTETLWEHVRAAGEAGLDGVELPDNELLAGAAWPRIDDALVDDEAEATFRRAQELVLSVRTLRAQHNVPPRKRIALSATESASALIDAAGGVVQTLGMLEKVEPLEGSRPAGAIPLAFEGDELLLGGLIEEVDLEAERTRLTKLIAQKEKALGGYRNKLNNPGYVNNAPPEVVEETRVRYAEAEADLAAARKALESLDAARP
jgi:valyl-tRNA synthetase